MTGSSKFHVHAILNDEDERNDLMQNVYVTVILARLKDVKNIRL